MNDAPLQTGGCHCGNLRYEITAPPLDSGYCHCRDCQLTSGAPVQPWISIPLTGFRITKGEPRIYRSSDHGRRGFCPDCGSQIFFREAADPKAVELNVATLEDPAAFPPRYHIWTKSRIAWFAIGDDLPRYSEGAPGD